MTRPSFPSNRAADEFARVVDGTAPGDVVERYAPLTRTVTLMREQPQPVPRPEFVADLRTRLMASAGELLATEPAAPVTPMRPRRVGRRLEHRLGAAAAAVVLVGSAAGMAAAAEGSLPGQTLYPVKRGIEQAEVAMNTNQTARGQELLDQAATRLQEVRDLVREGQAPDNAGLINQTLGDFTSSASRGSALLFSAYQAHQDNDSIQAVRSFTSSHMRLLSTLTKGSPHSTSPAFDRAGATLVGIDREATVLCRTCSAQGALNLPSRLLDLTSAKSLGNLMVTPVDQATRALSRTAQSRTEAHRAEQQAQDLSSGGATPKATPTTPAAGGLESGLESRLPTTQHTGSSEIRITRHHVTVKVGNQPLTDLANTLTSQGSGTDSTLGKTLDGVTKPLDKTLDGTTKLGGSLLGNDDQ
ncbi:MAG: DUF5667 domain-containing protein [Marmoricola sp.]